LAKKKKQKKRPTTPAIQLNSEEERQLASILKTFPDLDPTETSERITSPGLAQAVVEKLPTDRLESVQILSTLRERFEQKNVQKAIKKAIFKLGQKGISVPEVESDKDSFVLVRPTEDAVSEAHVSPVDGNGNRGVFVVLPQAPKGVNVGMGVVNDQEGILQFFYGTYSKKRMRELKSLFFANLGDVVDTSIPHVAMILEEAYETNAQALNEYSKSYLELRPWLMEHAPPPEKPVIYGVVSTEEISEDILTPSQIEKLLTHELMQSWGVDPEEAESLLNDIREAENSPILVNDAQRQDRVDEIKTKALLNIYTEEKRKLENRRLEEMAYIFYKREETEYAQISLAAALSLERKDSMLQTNPYLLALLNRSIDYTLLAGEEVPDPQSQEDDGASGLIIP
jgi:hypothetical protein